MKDLDLIRSCRNCSFVFVMRGNECLAGYSNVDIIFVNLLLSSWEPDFDCVLRLVFVWWSIFCWICNTCVFNCASCSLMMSEASSECKLISSMLKKLFDCSISRISYVLCFSSIIIFRLLPRATSLGLSWPLSIIYCRRYVSFRSTNSLTCATLFFESFVASCFTLLLICWIKAIVAFLHFRLSLIFSALRSVFVMLYFCLSKLHASTWRLINFGKTISMWSWKQELTREWAN